MHLTSSPIDWYAARAGGVVAYVLLSAVVLLGLTMSGKRTLKRWPRFAVEDIHRVGGLLVGSFVALHVITIAIDSYLPFSLVAIVVPLVSSYRQWWVGLGIVAAELLVALAITNHYRHRLVSHRFWRRAHYLNFAVWVAATLHGIGSGTDRSAAWLLAVYSAAVACVVGAIVWRVFRRRVPVAALRSGVLVAAVASVGLILVLSFGPFRFRPKPWNPQVFTETLTGQVLRDFGPTRGIISLAGEGKGTQHVLVRADLLIQPQGLLATSFQMEYLPSGVVCSGRVTKVHNLGFEARCRPPRGLTRLISAHWQLGNGPELAGGVITSRA